MEKLTIDNFKAFNSQISFDATCEHKNLLIYGENGSGKTSIFEAIKMFFYHNEIIQAHLTKGASPEIKEAEEKSFYSSFVHKGQKGIQNNNFTIKINDIDYQSFDSSHFKCYMVSNTDLRYKKYEIIDDKIFTKDIINIKDLTDKITIPDSSNVLKSKDQLISNVNNALTNFFVEDCKIGIENDALDIYINQGQLHESNGLQTIFNEAKINLIIILILLESIKLLQKDFDDSTHKLLVIDDIITSLDASNRLFFANYILSQFIDFQTIILTHNIGYNNLLIQRMPEYSVSDQWIKYNLYLTGSGPHTYNYDTLKSAGDIKNAYDNNSLNQSSIGIEIRKRFEADINEIAKMFQIDATSKAMDIINKITTDETIFLDVNKLVKKIDNITKGVNSDSNKVAEIRTAIDNSYSNDNLTKIQSCIKEFHFYEKLLIHSLSHGTTPLPAFNNKEIMASLKLLRLIEQLIKDIKSNKYTP